MKQSYLIRFIAFVWFFGTLYLSFLLFSTKTSLTDLSETGGFVEGEGGPRKDRHIEGPSIRSPVAFTKFPKFGTPRIRKEKKEKNILRNNVVMKELLNLSQPGAEWDKYTKYKNNGARRFWPLANDKEDRVLNQIHNIPKVDRSKPPKLIFMHWGLDGMPHGQKQFIDHQCPVNWCLLSSSTVDEARADLIFNKAEIPIDDFSEGRRNHNQISLLFTLESPLNFMTPRNYPVNWTATYRSDSVLNAPYERFTYFKNHTGLPSKPLRNFAEGKSKKVAWFVSNCFAPNGRMQYAMELAKYINVDIFGGCGVKNCPRDSFQCNDMLRKDYKFYLSFENSNCQDYITEKFFTNALGNDILPIVMGARPEDYKKLAPPNSYIHVDEFESPKALAIYLLKLDKNDDLYNKYFLWKGIGEFIDTKFWCRLCALLHTVEQSGTRIWYEDIEAWWKGPGVCSTIDFDELNPIGWASWRNYTGPKSNTIGTFRIIKDKKTVR